MIFAVIAAIFGVCGFSYLFVKQIFEEEYNGEIFFATLAVLSICMLFITVVGCLITWVLEHVRII